MRTACSIILLAFAAALLGGCGCLDGTSNPSCSSSPYGMTPEVPSFKEGGLGWR